MTTHPARGMRDFLPDDVRRRQYVIGVIAAVYETYGFEPLETPAVENIETLLGKYGEEGDKLIFRILKRGEGAGEGQADLALRYDLTVPLARVVAEYRAKLPKFFKRYQIQPVWRADRPQKGRFREFYQCDVDAIGSASMVIEAELLAAASEVMTRLGFSSVRIRLNHRLLLNAVLTQAGVPPAAQGPVISALDKVDKIGLNDAVAEIREVVGAKLADEVTGLLVPLQHNAEAADGAAANERALGELDTWLRGSEAGRLAVAQLRAIVRLLPRAGAWGLRVDPTLARGLSYYTGPIFEITVPDLAGSLAGGGRYDNLIGMFSGEHIPACGISLGLERILVVMAERGMFPPGLSTAPADVMVTLWSPEHLPDALALAGELRSAGLRVEVYPEADRIGRQFKYASGRAIPFVAVVGDEEAAQGTVSIKNLGTGEQQRVPRADGAEAIRRHISSPRRESHRP
jgi:histidyl-tRNA synthetase